MNLRKPQHLIFINNPEAAMQLITHQIHINKLALLPLRDHLLSKFNDLVETEDDI
jgi:hypothetical protein